MATAAIQPSSYKRKTGTGTRVGVCHRMTSAASCHPHSLSTFEWVPSRVKQNQDKTPVKCYNIKSTFFRFSRHDVTCYDKMRVIPGSSWSIHCQPDSSRRSTFHTQCFLPPQLLSHLFSEIAPVHPWPRRRSLKQTCWKNYKCYTTRFTNFHSRRNFYPHYILSQINKRRRIFLTCWNQPGIAIL